MNKFKIILYLGVGIMAFHLISGVREAKFDFSIFGAVLIAIGYLKYELWYSAYVILGILVVIELYNDMILMTTPRPTPAPTKKRSKPKAKTPLTSTPAPTSTNKNTTPSPSAKPSSPPTTRPTRTTPTSKPL